jgi:hypothetical protein
MGQILFKPHDQLMAEVTEALRPGSHLDTIERVLSDVLKEAISRRERVMWQFEHGRNLAHERAAWLTDHAVIDRSRYRWGGDPYPSRYEGIEQLDELQATWLALGRLIALRDETARRVRGIRRVRHLRMTSWAAAVLFSDGDGYVVVTYEWTHDPSRPLRARNAEAWSFQIHGSDETGAIKDPDKPLKSGDGFGPYNSIVEPGNDTAISREIATIPIQSGS